MLDAMNGTLHSFGFSVRTLGYPPDRALGYVDLERLVRAQLPSSRFVILGESFSGPIALRIAADPPPGLAGIVLSTTFSRWPMRTSRLLAWLARFAPTRFPPDPLTWMLLGRWSTPELRDALIESLKRVDPQVLRHRAAQALRVDASAEARSIRLPVLQLIASNDRLLLASASRALSGQLLRAKVTTLAGPHLLLQACEAEAAKTIAEFCHSLR
jgi:pimeloyl-ACP methyl ester carboxylesterase